MLEIANIVEACVEYDFWLNSTQEIVVDSASKGESTLKVDLTCSTEVVNLYQIKWHHMTEYSLIFLRRHK